MKTIDELYTHVRQIAQAFKVEIIEHVILRPQDAISARLTDNVTKQVVRQAVFIQPVTDEARYAIAMHEIGHCVDPLGFIPGSEDNLAMKLVSEQAAWTWARHYSLDWTVTMEHVAMYSQKSYEDGLRKQRHDEQKRFYEDQRRDVAMDSFLRKIGIKS